MKAEKPLELKRRTAGSAGSPRLTRRVAILTVLMLVAYLVLASVSCGPSPHPAQNESARTAMNTLRTRLTTLSSPLQGHDAQRAFEDLGSAMLAAHEAGIDFPLIRREVAVAEEKAASTSSGWDALVRTSAALNGHTLRLALKSQGRASSAPSPETRRAVRLAADTASPQLYYVNGVLNTWGGALEGYLELESAVFGADPDAAANMSFVYNWSTLQFGAHTDPCIESLIGSSFSSIKRLNEACGKTFGIIKSFLYLIPMGIIQPTLQKVFDFTTFEHSSMPVLETLLPMVKANIQDGKRVVLLSHSQGGLFLRAAMNKLQQWWTSDFRKAYYRGCKQDRPPVGALYIAPPFGSDSTFGQGSNIDADPTRYVMLKGDFLTRLPPVKPISSAAFTSIPKNPPQFVASDSIIPGKARLDGFEVHRILNYLQETSESRQQIINKFTLLSGYVNGLSGVDDLCEVKVSGVDPGDAPGGSSSFHVTVRGTGFTPTATLQFCTSDGSSCIPANSITYVESSKGSQMTADLNTRDATAGDYDVIATVRTADGKSIKSPACPACLHVHGEQPSPTPSPTVPPAPPANYYVFILSNVSSHPGSIFVGTMDQVQGKFTCGFTDGGLCSDQGGKDTPVQYEAKLGPFSTQEEATAAYCQALTNVYTMPLGGVKGTIFGDVYWLDNTPSCAGIGTPTPPTTPTPTPSPPPPTPEAPTPPTPTPPPATPPGSTFTPAQEDLANRLYTDYGSLGLSLSDIEKIIADNPNMVEAQIRQPLSQYADEIKKYPHLVSQNGSLTVFMMFISLSAYDPAHGGNYDTRTPVVDINLAKRMEEAETLLGATEAGDLSWPLTPSTDPAYEATDATGQKWDVKAFRSGVQPPFDVNTALTKIQVEVGNGESIIVNDANLSPSDVADLSRAIANAGLGDHVKWWPQPPPA